jgi:hypothetical protein
METSKPIVKFQVSPSGETFNSYGRDTLKRWIDNQLNIGISIKNVRDPISKNILGLDFIRENYPEYMKDTYDLSYPIMENKVSEQAPEQVSDQLSEQAPEQAPEQVSEQVSEQAPEQVSEQVSDQSPTQPSDNTSSKTRGSFVKTLGKFVGLGGNKPVRKYKIRCGNKLRQEREQRKMKPTLNKKSTNKRDKKKRKANKTRKNKH